MNLTSTTEEKVPVTLTPTTLSGKPAQLDGVPTWEVLSGDATVVAAEDGLSAYLVSADAVGSAQIKASADADLGEGVKTIEIIFDYSYTSPLAANLGATIGTAEPK